MSTNLKIENNVVIGIADNVSAQLLEEIIVPDYVTQISKGAFKDCYSLKSLTVPFVGKSIDRTNNTYLGYIFGAAEGSIENIPTTLEVLTVTGGESIGKNALYGFNNLLELNIGATVTSIRQDAFSSCKKLEKISVDPNNLIYSSPENSNAIIETATQSLILGCKNTNIPDIVTTIGVCAFKGCELMENLVLPESITEIRSYAFENCKSLKTISLPVSLTTISEGAFKGCNLLETITIPASAVIIDDYAFAMCDNLAEVLFGAGSGLEIIGENAFDGCNKLAQINLPDTLRIVKNYAFFGCEKLTTIALPNSLESIGAYGFSGCRALLGITLPENLKYLGECSFSDCTALKNIYLQSKIYKIGDFAFAGCTSLESLELTDNITKIGQKAFSGCSALTALVISEQIDEISLGAFMACSGLTDLSVTFTGDSAVRQTTTNVGHIFGASSHIDHPGKIPASLKNVYITLGEKVHDYSFSQCKNIENVVLSSDTREIGTEAFSYCENLKNISIPSTITNISESAFLGCDNLEYYQYDNGLYLGNDQVNNLILANVADRTVSSCTIANTTKIIRGEAIANCSNLPIIEIPSSVMVVGPKAFNNNTSLTIYCEHKYKPTGWDQDWAVIGEAAPTYDSEGNPILDENGAPLLTIPKARVIWDFKKVRSAKSGRVTMTLRGGQKVDIQRTEIPMINSLGWGFSATLGTEEKPLELAMVSWDHHWGYCEACDEIINNNDVYLFAIDVYNDTTLLELSGGSLDEAAYIFEKYEPIARLRYSVEADTWSLIEE